MKMAVPCFLLVAAVVLSGCSSTHSTSYLNDPNAPLCQEDRSPISPPLAGVRVHVNGESLDLYSPPTMEQAMFQASSMTSFELDDARAVVVTRADGKKVTVRRTSYSAFLLRNGDDIHVPRRILHESQNF